jgi:hypothetical protein
MTKLEDGALLLHALQHGWRDARAKRLSGLEIDDEFELGGLLNAKRRGFRASENLVDRRGRLLPRFRRFRGIGRKRSCFDVWAPFGHRRHPAGEPLLAP